MSDTPWNKALDLLARREYSQLELRGKLIQRFPEQGIAVEEALQRLEDTGLQSDRRFAEAFFRSQVSRNRGPIRIRHEARQKGIVQDIEQQLMECDVDWFELAREAAGRKLGSSDPADIKVKARMARFLAYRGFDAEHVRYSLEQLQMSSAES